MRHEAGRGVGDAIQDFRQLERLGKDLSQSQKFVERLEVRRLLCGHFLALIIASIRAAARQAERGGGLIRDDRKQAERHVFRGAQTGINAGPC